MIKHILVVILSLTLGSAVANDGPTYEQTVEFIKQKIATQEKVNFPRIIAEDRWTIAFPAQCVIEYTHQRYKDITDNGLYDLELIRENRRLIPLKKLIPSKIGQREQTIYFYAKSNDIAQISTEMHCSTNECITNSVDNYGIIRTIDNQSTKGLTKALIHLAKLCGAKEELF